jgi:predicted membrane protein
VGALFLLRNLGLLYIDDLWQYWPVILIVLGLSRVLSSFSFGSRFGGGLLLVVGSIFLLHNLDIIHGNIWGFFWPVLLIAIGAGLLFRHLNGPPHDWRWSGAVASSSSTGGDTLHAVAVFHGVEQSIDSQDFQGGEATAVFGGVEVDLRKAATTREEVRIEANAVFGGVDIRVPENWSVTVRGDGVFGGYDNKTINPSAKEPAKHPRLVITGGAVFGGVTVRN